MGYTNDTGYPSVTDVLSPYIDKRWFKDIHRKRGNEVHRVMSCVCSGAWSIPINAAWAGYVKSISLWLSKNVKEFLLVETRYSDDVYKYTGKLDLVAILMDERKALIDFKTSVAEYKTWKLQTAAYKLLYTKNNPKERPIDITMAVRGREDGNKPALVNEYHDFLNDSRHFLYANDLYHTLLK